MYQAMASLAANTTQENFKPYKMKIVWGNVMLLLIYHLLGLRALYYIFAFQVKWATIIWTLFVHQSAMLGTTAGAHRLWSHRTYKAKLPLRILLCFLFTINFYESIFGWVRIHRSHHKFADTDADPHNIKRGFFFAHMGWAMVRKHPDVITKGKTIDLSDLKADPVVAFQYKYIVPLAYSLSLGPPLIPWYFWNEPLYTAFIVSGILRFLITIHITSLVNSVAHTWGYKPYDKRIKAAETPYISALVMGESWHNYHHTFPWDYKTSELDTYSGNLTTAFIDLMAKIGWAYDLKVASEDLIQKKMINNR